MRLGARAEPALPSREHHVITVGDLFSLVAIEPCDLGHIESAFSHIEPVYLLLWVAALECDGLLTAIDVDGEPTVFDLSDRWERH